MVLIKISAFLLSVSGLETLEMYFEESYAHRLPALL